MKTIIAILLALAPSLAFGQVPIVGTQVDNPITVTVSSAAFTTLALNAPKVTDAIRTEGYRFVKFDLTYVYSTATAVTMTCKEGATAATADKEIQVLTYSGATATSEPHVWSQAVSANEKWEWVVLTNAYTYLVCTFSGTGAAVGDTLTVTAFAGSN